MSDPNSTRYVFREDPQTEPKSSHEDAPETPEPYVASKALIQAVNLAIYLRRPLLLEGEAGCGKTRLAHAVAYELGLPFYRWDVRSTSKAQEGLYTYDAILRLHDVQVQQHGLEIAANGDGGQRDPSKPKDYRRFGPLGKAFRVEDVPAVVLIDEIDKADLDFPNDLLAVLDDPWSFEIPETNETISIPPDRQDLRPIVIITSNKEKGNLPDPFLRRCIYFFLKFPDDQLQEIVEEHYRVSEKPTPDDKLLKTAIERFLAIRQDTGLYKKPGTSEFLDWIEALRGFAPLDPTPPPLTADGTPPYPSLLFKLRADWQQYVKGHPPTP
jgi:MoxR-like ATPase